MLHTLYGLGLMALGGCAALALSRSAPRAAAFVAALAVVVGGCLGLPDIVGVFQTGRTETIHLGPHLSLGLDPLSAFFLVPVLGLGALAAVYGVGYLRSATDPSAAARSWFFYNVLVASMALVVLARDGLVFLVAWETMALSSFFLVMFDHAKESTRQAGWIYLAATHLGVAFLLGLFLQSAQWTGSLSFDTLGALAALPADQKTVLFLLAVVGFGSKAGFMPFHVWLPEAHPAAPSHVSALMSGIMIKTGVYGLVRFLMFLGHPPAWWGWLLVAVGLVSGLLGVLFALAQHDLKRLLAYHSVENIGIIALGLGIGLLGSSAGLNGVAVLGFAGGLLHVLNHAVFKGLLFLGAGSVLHACGTMDMERLGGLLKAMPTTAASFAVGAVAICGLPPLNGFVSEFLIYMGAFRGLTVLRSTDAMVLVAAIAGLATIGALAVACFAKAFGVVFLGECRSELPHPPHEGGLMLLVPMLLLAGTCGALGLLACPLATSLAPAVAQACSLPESSATTHLTIAAGSLAHVTLAVLLGLMAATALALLRAVLLSGRSVTTAATWDCGYLQPSPRMQYTASSFADPIVDLAADVLHPERHSRAIAGYFPTPGELSTHTPDICVQRLYAPLFRGVERALSLLRGLQHGRVQIYVLYLVLTVIAMLAWGLQ